MFKINTAQFDKMDQLSQQKIPFFFTIDFLMENIEIWSKEQLSNDSLLVDFPMFKKLNKSYTISENIHWQSYPESLESYQKGFDFVQKNINYGNSYLVNYTRSTALETNLSLEEIFYRSKAKYKMLARDQFVFFSPETFVEIIDNKIVTHPMKGTIDASIENAEKKLLDSPKEKAEHYTVVDLLRNDLSMVADEVRVDQFRRIDFIKTKQKDLLAMSSEISGTLKPGFQNKVGSIMKMLLPAGSILGAPKQKTLDIILAAEEYDRGFYTGIAGYYDGENLDSCVMIRFIENINGKLFYKSGGGITHQSLLDDEYEEMKNKIYAPIY
ncbi:aminodeoxychorismate synthase component I [Chryseobacterium sp. T1]